MRTGLGERAGQEVAEGVWTGDSREGLRQPQGRWGAGGLKGVQLVSFCEGEPRAPPAELTRRSWVKTSPLEGEVLGWPLGAGVQMRQNQ